LRIAAAAGGRNRRVSACDCSGLVRYSGRWRNMNNRALTTDYRRGVSGETYAPTAISTFRGGGRKRQRVGAMIACG